MKKKYPDYLKKILRLKSLISNESCPIVKEGNSTNCQSQPRKRSLIWCLIWEPWG
jgi:hypothetical protein